jgi:hypothetical protein
VVTDPFDHKKIGYDALKLKAEIVTVSHDAPGHNYSDAVKGTTHVLSLARANLRSAAYLSLPYRPILPAGSAKSTRIRFAIPLYVFDYDGITVAHLGDIQQIPTQSEVELLGTVNVALLLPVGGGGSLNAAKAAEVVSCLNPTYSRPHALTPRPIRKWNLDSINKFIKEMGLEQVEAQPLLKVTRSSLPEETHVVVLDYQKG